MPDQSPSIGSQEIEQSRQNQPGGAPAPGAGLDAKEIESLLADMRKSGVRDDGSQGAADPSQTLGQAEIDSILGQRTKSEAGRESSSAGKGGSASASESQIARGDVELLLNQAQQALASIDSPGVANPSVGAAPFQLHEFTGSPPSTERATLDLIRNVGLDLKIELGRTHMYLEDVLKLRKGSVVPLDKLAGDPVDIYVNGRLIARGEVLVLNDNFSVRVAELIAGDTVKPG